MKQSLFRFFLVSLMVLPFLSCSDEEGFSSDVKFDVVPNVPFIILNDTVIGTGDDKITIKAPWFLAGFTIINENSDFELHVPSLRIQWTGIKNGQQVDGEMTLDADTACPFDDNPPRIRYATIPPNTAHLGDEDCDDTDLTDRALFYLHGLPEADSVSYFVTVTLEGFMFNDDPSDDDPVKGRVRKVISFSTQ